MRKIGKIVALILVACISTYVIKDNIFAEEYTSVDTATELKTALAAGESVKLTGDFELSETINIIEKTVTIDLNGHTITGKDNSTAKNFNLFSALKSDVTFIDSQGKGIVTLVASTNRYWGGMSTIIDSRGGILNIKGGSFKHLGGSDMAFVVNVNSNSYGSSKLNVYDGSLESTYTAIRLYMSSSYKSFVNVEGGNIDGNTSAIWAQAPEEVNLGQDGQILIKGGTIGTINASRGSITETEIIISGGSVKNIKCEESDLKITGGHINGALTILDANGVAVSSDDIITGGIFANNPGDYVSSSAEKIAAILTSGDSSTYAIGLTYVQELATTAKSGDEFVVGGDVDLTNVAAGVVVKSFDDSKVTANGVSVTETGITIKAEVKVELPVLVPTEKVDEVTVGVSDSSKITNVFVESLSQKVQSENNSDFADIVANNHVEVEVDITNVTEEQIDEQVKEAMEKVAGDATISTFFDITLAIKNTTDGSIIGELEELTEEIELMILLPEELKNTNNKVNRNYYIIRRHVIDNGVEIEKIKAQLSEDGNSLVFKTDKFSTYALAYEDVDKLTANPVTSDNLSLYLIIGSISIVGIAVTVIRSRKKFN